MTYMQRALVALALLVGAIPLQVHAERHALLVGVSGYPTLDKSYQLQGPRNDVQRLRQVLALREFKPEHVTVLADGVAGAQEPTRANIFKALDQLTQTAKAGDTVLLYFAGHGSQQPADRRTPEGRAESDGLHEIFLPIDVGRWDGKAGGVQNAVVNHELRSAVDRIQTRGAFVWGVFDACHSATMVRSAPDAEVRYRHVNPEVLGVDARALDAAAVDAVRTRGGPTVASETIGPLGSVGRSSSTTGGSVFFYAAQTTEVTTEMRLPLGDPQREPYGLFSFMLMKALELGQPMTYRQLGQYVLSQYGSMHEARVTPLFTGTALDQAVLGQQTLPVRQWPVTHGALTIPAGSLSSIAEGTVFALIPGPLAKSDDATGYLRARSVEIMKTELEPVAYNGKAPPLPEALNSGSYARLLSTPERYSLRVTLDMRGCRSGCVWQPALDKMRATPVPGADVQWVSSGADLVLQVLPDRITALSPSEQGAVQCASGREACREIEQRGTVLVSRQEHADPEVAQRKLAESLHVIARASNLLRLASRLAVQSQGKGIRLTVSVQPTEGTARQPLTPESVATLRPGDKLVIALENKPMDNGRSRVVDVTLLYSDARYGISQLFPDPRQGESNRLEPGARLEIDDVLISDTDGIMGIERLLLISVDAETHGERADFSFLTQSPLEAVRTRSGPLPDDVTAFLDAGLADYRTRGAPSRVPGSRVGMQVYTFDIKAGPAPTGR